MCVLLAGREAKMRRFGMVGCNAGAALDRRRTTLLTYRAVFSWGLKRMRVWVEAARQQTQRQLDGGWDQGGTGGHGTAQEANAEWQGIARVAAGDEGGRESGMCRSILPCRGGLNTMSILFLGDKHGCFAHIASAIADERAGGRDVAAVVFLAACLSR